jgi:glyoxylase-like metal-dependent hydrolase (beta-lactamase superfamily II)
MTSNANEYQVLGLQYGVRGGRKSHEFLGYSRYCEPDAEYPMSYYVWVARNATSTVLVDCGYSLHRAAAKGRYQENERSVDPLDMLSDIGVDAGSVDHVVLSHMHFDHVGNVDRFPSATFSIGRKEYDFWTSRFASPFILQSTIDQDELDCLRSLHSDGRLVLIDDEAEFQPGVTARSVGGHTPGQLLTYVKSPGGTVVLASDALHFYEEMELDRPFWFYFDLESTLEVYEHLRELHQREDVHVLPGHDPKVMSRFPQVTDHVVDVSVFESA